MMSEAEPYAGREQTLVKHFILRTYLGRFAHIVGTTWPGITYVDCFSGPWNVVSEDFSDSSFSIALNELRKAKATLAGRGRDLTIRCLFLEKKASAYRKLEEFAQSATDAEVVTHNADLESKIDDILRFVSGGRNGFPFIFIDPTGWTGFRMSAIAPLLQLNPGEVLINFMTGHIRRFVDSPEKQTQESFIELFGSNDYREQFTGLEKQDREDAIVQAYCDNVRRTGSYRHVCSTVVLHPEIDRTHFHLIYATRHPKGLEVFKDVEKQAMNVMEKSRSDAQRRRRERSSRQGELFGSEVLYESTRYEELRGRYLTLAKAALQQAISQRDTLTYDDAWLEALSFPLVWESDLKGWIRNWEADGTITVQGKKSNQRVCQRKSGHQLKWTGREMQRQDDES